MDVTKLSNNNYTGLQPVNERTIHMEQEETQIKNEHRIIAYQMISPNEIGMSGFAERLPFVPQWQEIVMLISQGEIEEARAKVIQAQS